MSGKSILFGFIAVVLAGAWWLSQQPAGGASLPVQAQVLRQPGRLQAVDATVTPDPITGGGDVVGWALSVGQTAIAATAQAQETQAAIGNAERSGAMTAQAVGMSITATNAAMLVEQAAAEATQTAVVMEQDAADRAATREYERAQANLRVEDQRAKDEVNRNTAATAQMIMLGALAASMFGILAAAIWFIGHMLNILVRRTNLAIERQENDERERATAIDRRRVLEGGETKAGVVWQKYLDENGIPQIKILSLPNGEHFPPGDAQSGREIAKTVRVNSGAQHYEIEKYQPHEQALIDLLSAAKDQTSSDGNVIPPYYALNMASDAWQDATKWLKRHGRATGRAGNVASGGGTRLVGDYLTIGALLTAVCQHEFAEAE